MVAAWLPVIASMVGCSSQGVHASGWDPVTIRPEGIVFIVPGARGGKVSSVVLREELEEASCPYTVVVYQWSRGERPGDIIEDINDRRGNLERARGLADMIETSRRTHPEGVIEIVAVSAGCGIAAFALEVLPDDVNVQRVLMIAPALSPGYDLSLVLRHVEKDLVAFVSDNDKLFLGLGTELFGTMDGVKIASAGHNGFVLPAGANSETRLLYEKLRQVRWDWDMILDGNLGTHRGWLSRGYIRKHVLPLLIPGR
jgi:hypothetical protein